MSYITNGVVKIGETVKTGDYESRRADVELSFNVPEGEDHNVILESVTKDAQAHVARILSTKPTAHVAKATPEVSAAKPAAKKTAPKMPAVETDPLDDEVTEMPKAAVRGNARLKEEPKKAEPDPLEDVEAGEDLGDLYGEAETIEITDKQLTDATQKCQQEVKNAPAIRKLLADLGCKPPKRLIDLAQDKRQTYLDSLKNIKPLA